jgi:CspA family cold shock protein
MTGTVVWFNETKGYGFIAPQGASLKDKAQHIFVHRNDILDGDRILVQGDRVEYEPSQEDRGPRAKNVKMASKGAAGDRFQKTVGEEWSKAEARQVLIGELDSLTRAFTGATGKGAEEATLQEFLDFVDTQSK